jgi:hypothetical protein
MFVNQIAKLVFPSKLKLKHDGVASVFDPLHGVSVNIQVIEITNDMDAICVNSNDLGSLNVNLHTFLLARYSFFIPALVTVVSFGGNFFLVVILVLLLTVLVVALIFDNFGILSLLSLNG